MDAYKHRYGFKDVSTTSGNEKKKTCHSLCSDKESIKKLDIFRTVISMAENAELHSFMPGGGMTPAKINEKSRIVSRL